MEILVIVSVIVVDGLIAWIVTKRFLARLEQVDPDQARHFNRSQDFTKDDPHQEPLQRFIAFGSYKRLNDPDLTTLGNILRITFFVTFGLASAAGAWMFAFW